MDENQSCVGLKPRLDLKIQLRGSVGKQQAEGNVFVMQG